MCSTSYAIADATNYITSSLDKTPFTMDIFIDLKKTFDTVNHEILLKKLNLYGIRGVSASDVLGSYLSNRSQCVSLSTIIY